MMTARKKPKPRTGGRWKIGVYELKRTAVSMAFSALAVGTAFITKDNINALWDQPGAAAAIGLIVAGLAKLFHQAYVDNSGKSS